MKLSSKSILDRVSKIEKKYTKSKQIRNDYDDDDDDDISIEETDFNTEGKTGYKSKILSQFHGKSIPQTFAPDRYLIDSNSLQHDSGAVWNEDDISGGMVLSVRKDNERRTKLLSEYGKESSVSLNKNLAKESIVKYSSSFRSAPLYLKQSYRTSEFEDEQNSVFDKNIEMQEHVIEHSHPEVNDECSIANLKMEPESYISDDCLHMNLNLKLDEDIDENYSSSGQNESCIFDSFNPIGQNIKPLEYLLDEDDKNGSDVKIVSDLNSDDLSECKDIATEADSLLDKVPSVSFAEEVMSSSNNSFSARTSCNSPLDETNINDFQINSFYNLNLNLPSLEDLMIEQEIESEVKKEYVNDSEKYQVNLFQSRSDNSIEQEKIARGDQSEKDVAPSLSKISSVLSVVNSVAEVAPSLSKTSLVLSVVNSVAEVAPSPSKTISVLSVVNSVAETDSVVSTINEDIKEDNDFNKTDKINLEFSHLQNEIKEISSSKIDMNNSEKFPRTCSSKNNYQIKCEDKSHEQKYLSNYKKNENLSLTDDFCFGKIRGIEELKDILGQEDTNLEIEEDSSVKSTTIDEDIEEDINCSIEDNIGAMKFSDGHDDMSNGTSPSTSNVPSLSLKQNLSETMLKKIEISESKSSELNILNSKIIKQTKTDLKTKTYKIKNTQKEMFRKQIDGNKNYSKIESESMASKSSVTNNKIQEKCTRNVSSQTNPSVMFLTEKDKEFDKKIEEIFTSSFSSIPGLTPYSMSYIPSGEESAKDLLGPFERGFHWALKQQVELTKHFIQSEYNMYATCMTAIKELSANYKPVSIRKYKKGKK